MALPKTYRAVARLGWTSTTGDPEGELSQTGRMSDDPQIPTGDLMQRPHAFSAVKVGGRRAYDLAREGESPELAERPVTVHRADRISFDGDRAEFEIECSSGTYIRQLVVGLEDAYCEQLERMAIGAFRLADADPERVVPLAEALAFLPERGLDESEAAAVAHGRRIAGPIDGPTRLTAAGELIAVGLPQGDEIHPDVVLVP
jgi:tRNA pseudouridine55 synthase